MDKLEKSLMATMEATNHKGAVNKEHHPWVTVDAIPDNACFFKTSSR